MSTSLFLPLATFCGPISLGGGKVFSQFAKNLAGPGVQLLNPHANLNPSDNQSHEEEQIRSGFDDIAPNYDRINDLMTFGLHRRWKRQLVRWLDLTGNENILDLCCGTGDLAYLCSQSVDSGSVTGIDFASDMLVSAQRRRGWCVSSSPENAPFFICGSSLQLPFRDEVFAGATVGYGLRNLADLNAGLKEVVRVLRPGGRFAILDAGPPAAGLIGWLHRLHLRVSVPLIGKLVHGTDEMYRYLASSALAFQRSEEMAATCERAGLHVIRTKRFLFGASYGVLAMKPAQ